MNDTEELQKAQQQFDSASRAMQAQLVGKQGNANEIRYGEAYQRLVRAGGAPQLKPKYTEPKRYR